MHINTYLLSTWISNFESNSTLKSWANLHHTHNYGSFLGQRYLLDPTCTSPIDKPTIMTTNSYSQARNGHTVPVYFLFHPCTYVFPLPALPWHSFWTPRHLKMKALCFFEKLGTNYPVILNRILEKHRVLNGIFLKWSADILVQKI